MTRLTCYSGFAALLLSSWASAAGLPVASLTRTTPVDYSSEIVPILKANCTACHNKTTTKGGLNMETPALMLEGGDTGPAIVPGKAATSLLFESATHQADSEMPPKGNKVGAVNLSPDELALLKLWIDQGAKAGQTKAQEIAWQPLPSHLKPIYAVAITPGGEIAACSRANEVELYDVAGKKSLARFTAHQDMTLALAFSPDGALLATGSFGEVKLWQANAALPPETAVARLTYAAGVAAFDVTFQTAAVAEQDKEIASLKDRQTKAAEAITAAKKKLTEKQTAHKTAVEARAKAPAADKAKVDAAEKAKADAEAALKLAEAALTDTQAEPGRLTTLQTQATAALAAAKAQLESAKAKQKQLATELAAASKAPAAVATATLPSAWKLVRTLGNGKPDSAITDRVNALAFSPDGKTLAVGSGAPSRGGDVTLWNVSTGVLAKTIADLHSDTVLSLDWSPDGKLLATGGADKQLRITDLSTGKLLKTFEGHTHHVMSVDWRADGRVVASAGADNVVKVWDWIKGERRKNLDGWDKEVTAVRYLGANNRLLTTSGDKKVRLIGEDASAPADLPGNKDFLHSGAVSRLGDRAVAGGEDGVLHVWDLVKKTSLATFSAVAVAPSPPAVKAVPAPAPAPPPPAAKAGPKLSFNKHIRPILSDKCFHCHGFDPKNRKADLRLDQRADAIAAKALIPGKAEESAIYQRMISHDADELMPPPKSKLPKLSVADVQTIARWINEGAEYESHWAFIPVKPTAAAQSIDGVVQQGLAEKGLKLQPLASAETLARRLSFDLTGLPPSPEQVTAFSAKSTQAGLGTPAWQTTVLAPYVDELLASPRYGERMAVDWLDVARYADSYGFQVDRDRFVWPWRDWVIKSYNQNLPFDQFVTWQIAGDMLPNATDEQRLASTFSRLHQQESEGGSVEEEYRVEMVADRVQTFATAFLGLTFECARCHDHKYDPISHRDYYGLFAMFQNIDEAGLYSFFTNSAPTPAMLLLDEAAKQKLNAAKAVVSQLEAKAKLNEGILTQLNPSDLEAADAIYRFDALLPGNKLKGEGDLSRATALGMPPPAAAKDKKPAPAPSLDGTLRGQNAVVDGREGKALQFSGDDPVDLPLGNFRRHDPFSVSLWIKTPDVKDRAVIFHRSRAWMDAASRGYELLLEEGKLKWSLIHFWPGDAISIRAKAAVPINTWTQVVVTHDGSSRAAGLRLYVNGKLTEVEVIKDHLTRDITGGGGDTISLGERFRDRGFKGGHIDDFRVYARDLSRPQPVELASALHTARSELTKLADSAQEIMVMGELPKPKPAFLLFRGEFDKRIDPVTAQTPAVLGLLPDSVPKNRLSMAKWLTDPKHPLFARVVVNRLWNSLFGRGLVKTAEDFGSQGEQPLYPQLLDHLAARFMSNGWNMKALVKEIVTSRTYLQRSVADAQIMTDDPENQWLARGARFRLSAEMIRDNALTAAGLIKHQVGGPPVNAYEMTEAFKPVAISPGDGVYRRSLYSHWRRTSPPPAMTTFDAPKRSVCIAQRERTDTPLQALVLMNGVQYVEAARVLGAQMVQKHGTQPDEMIRQIYLRTLSRLPQEKELSICRQLYAEQLSFYQAHPQEAQALLKHGTKPTDSALHPPAVAAATILAQALLSHDESIVKR